MAAGRIVSPVGASANEVAEQRAARSAEYRAERDRLAFWADIAAQVILYRTREGLSQADLAARIGTSHSAISRLESGQHATNVETLRRIGEALGLRVRFSFEARAPSGASDIVVVSELEGAAEPAAREPAGAA